MSDFQEDLFAAQVEARALEIQKEREAELLNDRGYLQRTLLKHMEIIESQDKQIAKYEPQAKKWQEYMDSDGYVSCAKIADMLRLRYMTPSGKMDTMGRGKLCQALAHDGVILKDGDGYRISRAWYNYAKTFPMVDAGGRKHHSVKFNSDGVDKIIDKYTDDTRHWVSIQTSKGWSIKAI